MKKYFNLNKLTVSFAFTSWIIPFFVSFFFINPETKQVSINNYLFHGILFMAAAVITFFLFKKLKTKNLLSLESVNTFLAVNIVLDILVLIILFMVPVSEWLTTILPAYFIVFYGLYKLLK